jgi:hypothetical protein
MTDVVKKKQPAAFQHTTSTRTLVAATRTAALPTAALLHVLLTACGRSSTDVAIRNDDPQPIDVTTTTSASAANTSTNATNATNATASEPPAKPMMGGATEIEQTIVLTPPPPPPPTPKPVLGKPHGIKPPKEPQPLGGDYMLVIPRPVGNMKPV